MKGFMGKKKLELDFQIWVRLYINIYKKIIYTYKKGVYLEIRKYHGNGFSFERMIHPGEQQHTRF